MVSRRGLLFVVAVAVVLIRCLLFPDNSSAHAALASTDPPANEIISRSPGRIELRYTEPLEEVYTKIILVDQAGATVPGTSFAVDEDDATLVRMSIPDDLVRGTYSVVWRTLSAADGHRYSGYFAFTIGSASDVSNVIPPTLASTSGPPFWLDGLSRWFAFLTVSLLAGLWFGWLVIIRPSLAPVWQAGPTVARRVKRYGVVVAVAYLASSFAALVVQVSGQTDSGWRSGFVDTLTDTRWGRFWALRVIFGCICLVGLVAAGWWWPRQHKLRSAGLLAISALLPLPHVLVSHASAQPHGRTGALVVDYLHLGAIGIWFGGLALILIALTASRELLPIGQKAVLTRIIPRFSAVALPAWATLGLTGFYAGYIEIGTWDGLFDTQYGRQLVYKLAILAVVLVIAALNLLIVSRYVSRSTATEIPGWWRRFGVLVSLEMIGVVAVLIFAGRLTGLEPSRAVLMARENQQEIAFDLKDRTATLSIAPGQSGPNHFRLDVHGAALDPDVTAAILLTPPVDMAGNRSIEMERTTGNAFEAHSAEMSVVGDWKLTITVSKIGAFQWSAEIVAPANERRPAGSSIGMPSWTLNTTGMAGIVATLVGIIGLIFGWRSSNRSSRREGFGLGSVALLAGMVLIVQGRSTVDAIGIPLDTSNPVPVTAQAIAVGESAFLANCIACHGVGGAGDGPAAPGMSPPPANLLEGHAIYHFDAEFFNWISSGKTGTAMPGFGQSLTEEQIWSTILYIRSLQQQHSEQLASPTVVPAGTPHVSPVP